MEQFYLGKIAQKMQNYKEKCQKISAPDQSSSSIEQLRSNFKNSVVWINLLFVY